MSETVVPLTDTAMGEAPSLDGTADANGIVKVSTLGSAGLKSLIGRRIDGEDIVKMSRRMKGAVRDEFIGYLEILSKNGQMYCRCAKRADIVTATDGMITMVGTDCLTATSPCCFVLGKLGQQPPLLVTKSDAKAVIASGQSKSGVQPSTSSTQTKINTGKKPSVPASKPPQKKPAKLTIDRSAGLLTKSGLYVTITDSSSRSNVASEMTAKKPTMKSRKGTPAPALMPSSTASSSASISHSSHLDFPASVASLDPLASANFTDMSLFNTPIDPNSFNLLQMLDPNFFDTSIDQLLASQQLPSTSIDPQVINDIMFDLSEFFSDPNMLSGLDPAFLTEQAQPPISNAINLPMMNNQPHLSGQFISSEIPMSQASSLSSCLSSEHGRSRENSLLDPAFMDLFCGGGNVINSPFSTAGSLDLMMTNCDLESLDGSTSVFSDASNQLDDMLSLVPLGNAIIQPAPWLPSLPEKDFPNVSPSSSISSISSFATSSSTVSGSHMEHPRAPSRKRQYPSTYIPTTTAASLPTASKRMSPPDLRKPSARSTPTPTSGTPVAGAKVTAPAKPQSLPRRTPSNLALTSTAPAIPRARSLLTPNGSNKPSASRASASVAPVMTRGTVGRGVGRVPTATAARATRATRPRAPAVSPVPAAGKKAAVSSPSSAGKTVSAPAATADPVVVLHANLPACRDSNDLNFVISDEIVMQEVVASGVVVGNAGNVQEHRAVAGKSPASALFDNFFDVAMDVDTGDAAVGGIALGAEKVDLTTVAAEDWFF